MQCVGRARGRASEAKNKNLGNLISSCEEPHCPPLADGLWALSLSLSLGPGVVSRARRRTAGADAETTSTLASQRARKRWAEIGRARIRAQVIGFKVQGDSHYTTQPLSLHATAHTYGFKSQLDRAALVGRTRQGGVVKTKGLHIGLAMCWAGARARVRGEE